MRPLGDNLRRRDIVGSKSCPNLRCQIDTLQSAQSLPVVSLRPFNGEENPFPHSHCWEVWPKPEVKLCSQILVNISGSAVTLFRTPSGESGTHVRFWCCRPGDTGIVMEIAARKEWCANGKSFTWKMLSHLYRLFG